MNLPPDETMLSSSKDLFMEYTSTENDKMMDGFKNKVPIAVFLKCYAKIAKFSELRAMIAWIYI